MRSLYLGSVVEKSGKSMVTLGLAKNFQGQVGFFKPFKERLMREGDRVIDQDAYLMRHVLNLDKPEEVLCPFTYDVFRAARMDEVKAAYKKAACDCEMMLIEGTREVTTGYLNDVSGLAITEATGSDLVLISTPEAAALDKIAMLHKLSEKYKIKVKGVILNKTDDLSVANFLESKGIKVLGCVPHIPEMTYFTVKEVAEALTANVLVGEGHMDRVVEGVFIGAMTMETALKYMRRHRRKAIITGGDRSDIQLAALSTDTSCLILTGGMYPANQVVSKAYEKDIPILVTRYDTLATSEMVEHLIARIEPQDAEKVRLVEKAIADNVDLEAVFR
ncbi:MAG TPA: DRTGG domain-containing protein [Methanomassiliicoccales archaeon]|nr:DRTGG domain-containing protein [Methanomassiliicoccales archaeon]